MYEYLLPTIIILFFLAFHINDLNLYISNADNKKTLIKKKSNWYHNLKKIKILF